jgi:general L-amino acid transport system substrate-binding protein
MHRIIAVCAALLCGAQASVLAASASPAGITSAVDRIRERGAIRCAVPAGSSAFAAVDGRGRWSGFDIAFCQAIAAAVFNDPTRVEAVPVGGADQIGALGDGRVDVVPRLRLVAGYADDANGVALTGVIFLDGPGFMTPAGKPAALNAPTICLVENLRAEQELTEHLTRGGKRHLLWTWADYSDAVETYLEGRCDAYSDMVSTLAEERRMLPSPGKHRLQAITGLQQPYRAAVRRDDADWAALVGHVARALVLAEEQGLTQEQARSDGTAATKAPGSAIGINSPRSPNAKLMMTVVRHVGNFGELFERTLGVASPYRLERGANALKRDGGLLGATED